MNLQISVVAMEAASQRVGHHHSGRSLMSDCPRSSLDSIPSPISPAPPGSLGYVITKEHVDEMRRMEKLCAAKEEKLHREYKPVFLPVDEYLSKEINCELINVDIRSYPWKNTPFGRSLLLLLHSRRCYPVQITHS